MEQEKENDELRTVAHAAAAANQRTIDASFSRGVTSKANRYAMHGLISTVNDSRMSVRDKAEQLFDDYLFLCRKPADIKAIVGGNALSWNKLLVWWKDIGMTMQNGRFSSLGKVFKILLTVPGAAAGLERDFSVAGSIVTPKRSSLDAAWVEMSLFLYLNKDLIPPFQFISPLDEAKTDSFIPRRLREKADLDKFKEMDVHALALTREENERQKEDAEVEEAGGDEFMDYTDVNGDFSDEEDGNDDVLVD